ncbi:MAG: tetratricopeptide repeat protein [Acidobacteriota bacterium]
MNGKLRTMIPAFGLALTLAASGLAQTQPAPKPDDQRATAYYNFAMGHMYAELAATYGYRSDYVDKAIGHYRAALTADPSAGYVSEELTDLYMQSGKLRDAVTQAEEMLKVNPDNIEARRMLGRIYARLIGDQQQSSRVNDQMLKKAIEQYEKVVAVQPDDTDSWLMLGRLHKVAQNSADSEKAYKKALELDPDNEFAISGLAQVYSDLGDSRGALEMWKKLAEKDPRPQALVALANAYEQAHDYKSAAQTLRRALEAAPKDPEIKKNLAQDLLMSEQPDEALKLFEEMAAAEPNNAAIQIQLSRIYRVKGDFAKAHAAQNRAREIAPDNLEVKYNEVNLLEAEGKLDAAIAQMKELLNATAKKSYTANDQSNRGILLNQLAALYRESEKIPEAVETYRSLIQLDPDNGGRASALIVETYRQAKDYAKAEQEADAALKRYPNDRTLALVRASLIADMGRIDEAAAATRKLLDGKNDRDTYLALAQIYEKGKRFKEEGEAIDSAEKLCRNDDDLESVVFMRGAMYEKMNNLDAAEAQFRKVLEINPQNAGAMNYLGYMLADRNIRLQEAFKLIAKAVELEPNNGAYLDSLGWVNFRLGRLDEAETALRRALERTSTGSDPTVRDHLGDVYLEKGRFKDAIAQWEISLREWNRSAKSELDPVEVAKIQKKLENARVRLAKESGSAPER